MQYKQFPFWLRNLAPALVLCWALSCTCRAEKSDLPQDGYSCVLMGHSFFIPMARQLEDHAKRSGFSGHKQIVAKAGGAKGSPGALWKALPEDAPSREAIRSGSVDLVGLTAANSGSTVTDYKAWVDFALKHNPRTSFFIMAPSPVYGNKTFAEFEKGWEKNHKDIHALIDLLRTAYPGTTFFCIPQGQVLVDLWSMSNKGQLPEVTRLKGAKESSIFLDDTGHGGEVVVNTGSLLWLATIYGVDLAEYKWDPKTKTDLKALARKITRDDPYCKH